MVTDYGGLLSHGPIVAREPGIPCLCGTEIRSRRIRDGQQISVDGDADRVEILEPDGKRQASLSSPRGVAERWTAPRGL